MCTTKSALNNKWNKLCLERKSLANLINNHHTSPHQSKYDKK